MPWVDVPRAVVEKGIFPIQPGGGRSPKAPIARVAQVLGFEDVEIFRRLVVQWWPAWDRERKEHVSPAELVALIHLLQFKTAAARKLVQDLMDGGAVKIVKLPSEALRGLPEDSRSRHEESATPSNGSSAEPVRLENTQDDSLAAFRELPWVACDPEEVGMDKEPLEKCRRYLKYRVGRNHFAGLVQGIVKNGKLVHFQEAGFADIAAKTPMRQDTLIRLFSMTKCIVAAAFLTYAEDPSYDIDLDDQVWKYIPSFKKLKIAPKRGSDAPRQIESRFFDEKQPDGKVKKVKLPKYPTLRQLLTHTAGFGYGPTLGDNWPATDKDHYKIYEKLVDRAAKKEIKSIEEWVDELAKVPLKYHPGTYWEYSFATDVLGRVIEVISGKNLEDAVQERVCGPLGMVDTFFKVPPEKVNRIGGWYKKKEPLDEKGVPLEKVPPGAKWDLECIDPAGEKCGWFGNNVSRILSGGGTIEVPLVICGGLLSTFRDYLRFLIMIRNFGELDGVRILRRETVQTMICNQVPASTGRKAAWVFDKKGQGYNFMGQVQVQHNEKEHYKENHELKRGNNTYASLAPGTVSAEFGWGGLGGPAWTIDPRADLIILSMTQTALELDHEENLRYSARKAIHAGIFGDTVGGEKVTDYPSESHEGKRGGKLRQKEGKLIDHVYQKVPNKAEPGTQEYRLVTTMPAHMYEAELKDFEESAKEATNRKKTLKELSIAAGNAGHEVEEDDMESIDGKLSIDEAVPAKSPECKGPSPSPEAQQVDRVLRHPSSPSASSAESDKDKRSPNGKKREKAEDGKEAEHKAKKPKVSAKDKVDGATAIASPQQGVPLFARVSMKTDACGDNKKARVTGREDGKLEVVTEVGYHTVNLREDDVSLIDETQFGMISSAPLSGPSDFSFIADMDKKGMLTTPSEKERKAKH